jgi:hypothetical protein
MQGVTRAIESMASLAAQRFPSYVDDASAGTAADAAAAEGRAPAAKRARGAPGAGGSAGPDEAMDGDGDGATAPSGSGLSAAGAAVGDESRVFARGLADVRARAERFRRQSGDASHPFAFAFVEGLLVKVREEDSVAHS